MLWREAYKTRLALDLPLPRVEGRSLDDVPWVVSDEFVLIAGFALESLPLQEVWLRLLDSAFSREELRVVYGIFVPKVTPALREAFESAVPPSRVQQAYLWTDPAESLRGVIEPDRPERTVAMACLKNTAALAMIGIPTEEAWDLFESTVRTWLTDPQTP